MTDTSAIFQQLMNVFSRVSKRDHNMKVALLSRELETLLSHQKGKVALQVPLHQ